MMEGEFISGDSPVHRTDPRARLSVAFVLSMIVAFSERPVSLLFALCLGLFLVLTAGLPLKRVAARLLLVNGMILLIWLVLPFSNEGEPLFSIGSLAATRSGVHRAALITLKSNTIILILMALVATMSVFTMGNCLQYFGIPSKMVYLLFLTYRYVHVLLKEYDRLKNAARIRGFRAGTNAHTYRTYAYLLGMLLVKSYARAERVSAAMRCRGFKGRFYSLAEYSFKKTDAAFLFAMLLAIGVVASLEWVMP